jgi:hypothetical protein
VPAVPLQVLMNRFRVPCGQVGSAAEAVRDWRRSRHLKKCEPWSESACDATRLLFWLESNPLSSPRRDGEERSRGHLIDLHVSQPQVGQCGAHEGIGIHVLRRTDAHLIANGLILNGLPQGVIRRPSCCLELDCGDFHFALIAPPRTKDIYWPPSTRSFGIYNLDGELPLSGPGRTGWWREYEHVTGLCEEFSSVRLQSRFDSGWDYRCDTPVCSMRRYRLNRSLWQPIASATFAQPVSLSSSSRRRYVVVTASELWSRKRLTSSMLSPATGQRERHHDRPITQPVRRLGLTASSLRRPRR